MAVQMVNHLESTPHIQNQAGLSLRLNVHEARDFLRISVAVFDNLYHLLLTSLYPSLLLHQQLVTCTATNGLILRSSYLTHAPRSLPSPTIPSK